MKKPARSSAPRSRAPVRSDQTIRSFFQTIARMSDKPPRRAAASRPPKTEQA
ncbi:hypothetical protein [Terrarubrum flagellatum]|uniref:hypothetical protein n=1 Tax=Terrirubrum flagellatum TaxID=2895980 RepID=UPI00314555A0